MQAEYAIWPVGTRLQQDYSSHFVITSFVRDGVAYEGAEAQPEFTPTQRAELEAVGLVFFSSQKFNDWKDLV